MIRHIFKIIWNERKSNSWIVLEYILVFCILWFCCDYLYYINKCYHEPLGFDIENTYSIDIFEKESDGNSESFNLSQEDKYSYALMIMDRLKQHPDVESVCFANASVPYRMAITHNSFFLNSDSAQQSLRTRAVSSGFFDVFKVKLIKGHPFDWTDPVGQKQLMISSDRDGSFGKMLEEEKLQRQLFDITTMKYRNDEIRNIVGYTEKIKDAFYEPYESSVFVPLRKEHVDPARNQIAIRTRPNVGNDFEERFMEEMRAQLNIGPYVLIQVTSMKKLRDNATLYAGITSNLKSIYSITLFLIINIFLGIIGTFWYRTEARKGEIGLRIALGSSKWKINKLMYTETLCILLISSVIGVNICINIGQTDLLSALGIPQSNAAQVGSGMEQYFINFGITFLFLAITSLIAVWYPVKQASDIPPAQALHEE